MLLFLLNFTFLPKFYKMLTTVYKSKAYNDNDNDTDDDDDMVTGKGQQSLSAVQINSLKGNIIL